MKGNENTAICIVGNFSYIRKYYKKLLDQLTTAGKYSGDLVLITGKYTPTFHLKKYKNINLKILRFSKIKFTEFAETNLRNLKIDLNRHIYRNFQWYKINLFDEKMKNWDFIFYLDLNMNIHFDINELLNAKKAGTLLAREDAYPTFEWCLEDQFDKTNKIFKSLEKEYDLSINDYFQTGVLFYDTSIINNETKREIIDLVNTYPISKTNEQGIFNLYFIYHKKNYETLPINVGEYMSYYYWKIKNKKIIITKASKENTN